jgi:hypothetical protein
MVTRQTVTSIAVAGVTATGSAEPPLLRSCRRASVLRVRLHAQRSRAPRSEGRVLGSRSSLVSSTKRGFPIYAPACWVGSACSPVSSGCRSRCPNGPPLSVGMGTESAGPASRTLFAKPLFASRALSASASQLERQPGSWLQGQCSASYARSVLRCRLAVDPWVRAFHSKSGRAARPLSSWELSQRRARRFRCALLANRRPGRDRAQSLGVLGDSNSDHTTAFASNHR